MSWWLKSLAVWVFLFLLWIPLGRGALEVLWHLIGWVTW